MHTQAQFTAYPGQASSAYLKASCWTSKRYAELPHTVWQPVCVCVCVCVSCNNESCSMLNNPRPTHNTTNVHYSIDSLWRGE